MIVDTSALIAISLGEDEAEAFTRAIAYSPARAVSAATYLETGIVIDSRHDPVLSREFDELLAQLDITIEPVTAQQARIAREAYRDFGRGSGHPARLNFGDCFAYALAKETRDVLLFKGQDFSHTDVTPANVHSVGGTP